MSFFIFEWTLHFFHLSSLRQLRLAGLCLQKKFCFYILKHYVYLLVDVLLLGQKIAKIAPLSNFSLESLYTQYIRDVQSKTT